MKKLILLTLCYASLQGFAQSLKLDAGKKLGLTTINEMDMDMGMAGKMKITTQANNTIVLGTADADAYKATSKLTRMKITQEGMGKSETKDTDVAADMDTDEGKELAKDLNVEKEITINKNTGTVKATKPEDKDDNDNPMAGLMGGATSKMTEGFAFMAIPVGKKAGDKWADSTTEAGVKTTKNYQIKSIENGIASVNVATTIKGTFSQETQGMQMEMTLDGTGNGVYTVEAATGIVKKSITNNDINGSMDMMGQSIPLTIKAVVTTTVD